MRYFYAVCSLIFVFNFRFLGIQSFTSRRLFIFGLFLLLMHQVLRVLQGRKWLVNRCIFSVLIISLPAVLIILSSLFQRFEFSRSLLLLGAALVFCVILLMLYENYRPDFDDWFSAVAFVYWCFSLSILLEMSSQLDTGISSLRDAEVGGVNYLFNHYVVLSIVYIWFLFVQSRPLVYAVLVVSAILIISSLSRQNFGAFLVAVLLLFLVYGKNRLLVLVSSGSVLTIVLSLFSDRFVLLFRLLDRIQSLQDKGSSGRLDQFRFAWSLFSDNAWFGVGLGGFSDKAVGILPHVAPESSYNQALAEGGLFGLIVILVFFATAIISLLSSINKESKVLILTLALSLGLLFLFNELLLDALGISFILSVLYFSLKRRSPLKRTLGY